MLTWFFFYVNEKLWGPVSIEHLHISLNLESFSSPHSLRKWCYFLCKGNTHSPRTLLLHFDIFFPPVFSIFSLSYTISPDFKPSLFFLHQNTSIDYNAKKKISCLYSPVRTFPLSSLNSSSFIGIPRTGCLWVLFSYSFFNTI